MYLYLTSKLILKLKKLTIYCLKSDNILVLELFLVSPSILLTLNNLKRQENGSIEYQKYKNYDQTENNEQQFKNINY